MKVTWAHRERAAPPLLVLVAVLALGQGWSAAPRAPGDSAPTGGFEHARARFEPLRAHLPREGVVGYISAAAPGRVGASQEDFYFAQTVLAPLTLVGSVDPELVIGDFYVGAQGPQVDLSNPTLAGLRLERDFGEGLLLFARPEP